MEIWASWWLGDGPTALKLDGKRRGNTGWQRGKGQRALSGGCLDSVRKSKGERLSGKNTHRARELGVEAIDWSVCIEM